MTIWHIVCTMETVLVTGASGFIGSNLIPYLRRNGAEIVTLKYRENMEYDIPPQVNAVIHLAGKAHDLKNTSSWEDYYRANFEYTRNIYDAFLNSRAQKFVFVSTVKAVADHTDEPLSEDSDPDPKTAYGHSKLLAEEYIRNQSLPEGKSYYILRPCMVHGPGNKGNLNLLYQFVSKGLPYPLAVFQNKRSFLSIENLCFVIKELLESADIPSGVYNVADDEALSTNEVVTLLSLALNKKPKFLYLPKQSINFLARIGDALRLPLNTEKLGKLTENYMVNNTKIKQVLKKELPLSAREGILKTAKSFGDQG